MGIHRRAVATIAAFLALLGAPSVEGRRRTRGPPGPELVDTTFRNAAAAPSWTGQAGAQIELLSSSAGQYQFRVTAGDGDHPSITFLRPSWRIPEAFAPGVGIPVSGRLECQEKTGTTFGPEMGPLTIAGTGLSPTSCGPSS